MKIEGYTAKEVGIKLNMSESAVKTSAHRTYKMLKEKIENK
jgi:DNA-directed RNA polymerase specialized sigma24 family protein